MKKIAMSLTMALSVFFVGAANAETEVDAWYLSKGNEYLVKEATGSTLYGLVSISKGGKPFVYIVNFDKDCEGSDSNIIRHDPLLINGVLTRFNQYCEGTRRYFLPASDAGREHIINEFKKKNFVEVAAHDGKYKFLFSAKGFTDAYNKVIIGNSGI